MMKSSLSKLIHLSIIVANLLTIVAFSGFSIASTYDDIVNKINKESPLEQKKTLEELAYVLMKDVLSSEYPKGPLYTENTFCFGNFINSESLDLAVGISNPPYYGNIVILSQVNGHYSPVSTITHIGFVEAIEPIRLFPGQLNQLVLNLYDGGSGWNHWGKDIYKWDGQGMRLIWAYTQKDERIEARSETIRYGGVTNCEIIFGQSKKAGAEIITLENTKIGIFTNENNKFAKVDFHKVRKVIHKWDENYYFYVEGHGIIKLPSVTVQCTKGIPQKEITMALSKGQKFGIFDTPGYKQQDDDYVYAVIGKENFCAIPKNAVNILD